MADEYFDEAYEMASGLSDYYSNLTGRSVDVGIDGNGDIWISGYRTSGREYFSSVEEAERRLEIVYENYLTDNGDTSDPLEELW